MLTADDEAKAILHHGTHCSSAVPCLSFPLLPPSLPRSLPPPQPPSLPPSLPTPLLFFCLYMLIVQLENQDRKQHVIQDCTDCEGVIDSSCKRTLSKKQTRKFRTALRSSSRFSSKAFAVCCSLSCSHIHTALKASTYSLPNLASMSRCPLS